MTPYYEKDGVILYCGDCRTILPGLEAADLCFTSPPYGQQRDYESPIANWNLIVPCGLSSLQWKKNTQLIINLGLVHRDGEIVPYWNTLIDCLRCEGWRHYGWYVWDQMGALPGSGQGRLGASHEWLFHFNREMRLVNKTKPCKWAGEKNGSTSANVRDAAGTTHIKSGAGQTVGSRKILDSVVRIPRWHNRVNSDESWGHPAPFPESLAKEIILAFTDEDDLVIDPFMGCGSTVRAAVDCGRRVIGIDSCEKYCESAAKRMRQQVLF